MSRLRGWTRLLLSTWVLLQVAVAPMLALVDGVVALRSPTPVVAHAEGHSTRGCQPPHTADCALCQFLSTHAAESANDGGPGCVVSLAPVQSDRLELVLATIAPEQAQSRAPPRS